MKTKSNKNETKGQAALEFMMTYGWAVLLLMTVVSALIYAVPKPSTLTTDRCVFGPSMPCMGTKLNDTNLTIVLKNALGQTVYNFSANVTMPMQLACSVSNITVSPDERVVIYCSNAKLGLTTDTRLKVSLTYKKIKGGFDQTIPGEIYAKYEG